MRYREVIEGRFIDRPNRFIAHVLINGVEETVHVKNTGRCRELLLPNAEVRLAVSDNPNRKTKCDLVAVYKEKLGWVNIDSQAPNKVVQEWLETQDYSLGYFPDAPTERGVKHLKELTKARTLGYECIIAFVIQMEGVSEVRPYISMQPEFGEALEEAKAAGVKVLFLQCEVGRDTLQILTY